MRKESWASLAPNFERYTHVEAVGRFVEQAAQELRSLALILFGSLARGDYHQYKSKQPKLAEFTEFTYSANRAVGSIC